MTTSASSSVIYRSMTCTSMPRSQPRPLRRLVPKDGSGRCTTSSMRTRTRSPSQTFAGMPNNSGWTRSASPTSWTRGATHSASLATWRAPTRAASPEPRRSSSTDVGTTAATTSTHSPPPSAPHSNAVPRGGTAVIVHAVDADQVASELGAGPDVDHQVRHPHPHRAQPRPPSPATGHPHCPVADSSPAGIGDTRRKAPAERVYDEHLGAVDD